METSILKTTKKILGLADTYTAFDLDIIVHINAALSTLNQLGVGPDGGLSIEDASAVWDDLYIPDNQLNMVKTYIYLKARMLFDPPGTSFVINALEQQLREYEYRISEFRELLIPVKVTHEHINYLDGEITTTTTEDVITW